MAQKKRQIGFTSKPKPKVKRLKAKKGVVRKPITLRALGEIKEDLFAEARARRMTVNYYMNWTLWKDWM